MMRDAETVLSDEQAVTSTAVSTNTYDSGFASKLGAGEPIDFRVSVGTDFAGLTNLQVQVIASANADLSSPVILSEGPVVGSADLVNNKVAFAGKIPLSDEYRYYGFNYVVSGTASAGTINASLVLDQAERFDAQSGYTV